MKTRITMLPLAAVLAAGALAGCGDDKKEGATPTPTSADQAQASKASTPETSWAAKLCTTMAGKAKTVQPPKVDASSPAATKKALITFFSDVGEQLNDQVDTVKEVGPPPTDEAKAAWNKAVDRMSDVENEVAKIRKGLRAADYQNAADVNAVVEDLGKQMNKLTQYQGPVAELSENKALSEALVNEPACSKVS